MLIPTALCACMAAIASPPQARTDPVLRPEKLPPADAVLNETFTALTSIRELGDGRVLLSDPREGGLVVADFSTQRVQPLSRKGEGPGEFKNAVPFHALSADSSVSADAMTKRWLFFKGDSVVATRTVSDPEVRLVTFPYGFDNRGFLLTTRSPPTDRSGNVRSMADSTYLVLISRVTATADTIGRLRPSQPSGESRSPGALRVYRSELPGGLRTYEQAVLAFDGWVAVARLEPYRIDWRSPAGRWIRGAPLPVPTEPMDNAEREAYRSQLRPGQRFGSIEWPDNLPPFTAGWSPIPTFDGKVVIRRAPSVHNPGARYDVVDRQGRLIRQLILAPNERILGFGQSSVYVVRKDELDLETVSRHRWS